MVKPVLKYLKESEKQVQESVAPADEDLLSQKADFETTLRILKRPKMSTSAKTIADITGDLDEVQQSIQSQLDARVQQDMREGIAKVIQDVRTMIKSNFVYAADVV